MAADQAIHAGGGIALHLEGDKEISRLFGQLLPKQQKAALRKAGRAAAILVRRTARATAPLGRGLTPRGTPRKHLRDALIYNTKSLRNGSVSTIVGADYRIAPHMHLAHEGAKLTIVKTKKRSLTNFKTAPAGQAKFFGKEVKIPQRKSQPFLRDALTANTSKIEQLFSAAVREAVSGVST